MNLKESIKQMNAWGKNALPFFFIFDFYQQHIEVFPLTTVHQNGILFDLNEKSNLLVEDEKSIINPQSISSKIEVQPVPFETYLSAFNNVQKHLQKGNSFLVNLTFPTPIQLNMSLRQIFEASSAKYRLLYKDKFVVFSPETFVKIESGNIFSNPMKGTISATIPQAEKIIIADKKEFAEHTTIVDLIRNDLSRVASKVKVDTFRYVERLETNRGAILQVSSQISGKLPNSYPQHIGTILTELLPAGSVSGAPKPKTINIIRESENYNRGFYTGVCGIFDGENLDSTVMIRFIEKTADGMIFKSGGGITAYSDPEKEYQELIDKVYLPFS